MLRFERVDQLGVYAPGHRPETDSAPAALVLGTSTGPETPTPTVIKVSGTSASP